MATGDLASLANVKQWLGITDGNSDALLSRLITAVSARVGQYINRTLPSTTYTETRNGNAAQSFALRNWPVTAVASVFVDDLFIPLSPDGITGGYVFDDKFIYLQGIGPQGRVPVYAFTRGYQNIRVVYTAGYAELGDLQAVPATGPYQIAASSLVSFWAGDLGVTYASGAPLTKVLVSPAAGQYTVSVSGLYTFNIADASANVLISYGTIPADVQQAVIDWVSFASKVRGDRIGVKSKGLAGETIVYDTGSMPSSVSQVLDNYRKRIPI